MTKHDSAKVKVINQHGPTGFVAFIAFIGAFVHFAQGAGNPGDFIWAFLQACVWPAIAVYHILHMLGA